MSPAAKSTAFRAGVASAAALFFMALVASCSSDAPVEHPPKAVVDAAIRDWAVAVFAGKGAGTETDAIRVVEMTGPFPERFASERNNSQRWNGRIEVLDSQGKWIVPIALLKIDGSPSWRYRLTRMNGWAELGSNGKRVDAPMQHPQGFMPDGPKEPERLLSGVLGTVRRYPGPSLPRLEEWAGRGRAEQWVVTFEPYAADVWNTRFSLVDETGEAYFARYYREPAGDWKQLGEAASSVYSFHSFRGTRGQCIEFAFALPAPPSDRWAFAWEIKGHKDQQRYPLSLSAIEKQ